MTSSLHSHVLALLVLALLVTLQNTVPIVPGPTGASYQRVLTERPTGASYRSVLTARTRGNTSRTFFSEYVKKRSRGLCRVK